PYLSCDSCCPNALTPVARTRLSPAPFLCSSRPADHRHLHSFPTRRSSDLLPYGSPAPYCSPPENDEGSAPGNVSSAGPRCGSLPDRKSTRLNSSHVKSSYAVFCLKKKKASLPWTTHGPPLNIWCPRGRFAS